MNEPSEAPWPVRAAACQLLEQRPGRPWAALEQQPEASESHPRRRQEPLSPHQQVPVPESLPSEQP